MRFKKTAALVLALSFAAASGCSKYDDQKDSEKLQDLTGDFISAIANEDKNAAEDLTAGFDYDDSVGDHYTESTHDIVVYTLQYMEVSDFGDPVFDRREGTAEAEVEITYFNLGDFTASLDNRYLNIDEYFEAIDNFSDRDEKTLDLTFVYDEDDGEWLLSNASAKRIVRLFMAPSFSLRDPVEVSPADGLEIFESYFELLAAGDFDNLPAEFDYESNRTYDNVAVRGEGERTQEAYENFISSYVGYILDHDPDFVLEEDPYDYTLLGSAPSADDLYAALTTDEFLTEYYANFIRYSDTDASLNDIWDFQSALIYNTLADAVDSCSPESCIVIGYIRNISYDAEPDYQLFISSNIIREADNGIFEAEHSVPQDQYVRCYEAALDMLLENGEITNLWYNSLHDAILEDVENSFIPAGGVSSQGHPNQALGTYEQVPEWCEDGSMVYGYSNPDSNGFWMFYSKSPDVLDTVGYYLDEEGLWITCYFCEPFESGTDLIYDWWINGDLVVDTAYITVVGDGHSEIEVFIPWDEIPTEACEFEMRLWEDNHSHVLAYVTITKA